MDLVEFLRARLAEDEQVARAASPGGWTYGDVDSVAGGSLYDESRMIGSLHYEQPGDHDGRIVRHLLADEADANGAHIARHDPARVLAEVEAKRLIVDLHKQQPESNPYGDGVRYYCWECEYQTHSETPYRSQEGCQTLRALALPYAAHPDYDESWRP